MAVNDSTANSLNQSIDRIYDEVQRIQSDSTMSVKRKQDALILHSAMNENLRRSTDRSLTHEHGKMKTTHDQIQKFQRENETTARRDRQKKKWYNNWDTIKRFLMGMDVRVKVGLALFSIGLIVLTRRTLGRALPLGSMKSLFG
jgi:hypothetical protein